MGGTVESENAQVLEVAPGLEDGEYIFMARTKGHTTVRFMADGAVVAIANVEIGDQTGSR